MQIDKKYDQWKAITESDFVTLFIKTWFTFIAVLREMNPSITVFTEDGMPKGDRPFLNAFRDGIVQVVQRKLLSEQISNELHKLYPLGMKKVLSVFPQYFFQTFYLMNDDFKYTEIIKNEYKVTGSIIERYDANIHIVKRYSLKVTLGLSGIIRRYNYNETLKKDIDLRLVIQKAVDRLKSDSRIGEIEFMGYIYEDILNEIETYFEYYKTNKLPMKPYSNSIKKKISDQCSMFLVNLRLKFSNNYKYPHQLNSIAEDVNTYAIFKQMPYNLFYKVFEDNVNVSHKEEYDRFIVNRGILWFGSFVYSLRNALFHEIISPLDEEWQIIFKAAYSILKEMTDVCVDLINELFLLEEKDNIIEKHIVENTVQCIQELADFVEVLSVENIKLSEWKIQESGIEVNGTAMLKLKLQNGTNDGNGDQEGQIEIDSNVLKAIHFFAKLDDSLNFIKTDENMPILNFTFE